MAYNTTRDVLVPPPLAPPAAGDTYVDPVFGSVIRRLTDDPQGYVPEYSESSAFSLGSKWLLLFKHVVGGWGLFTGDGDFVRDLSFRGISGQGGPRWSRRSADTLYYAAGSSIRQMNVATQSDVLVRDFQGLGFITFNRGEGDIALAPDGSRMITTVVSPQQNSVFAYDLLNDKVYPSVSTGGVDAIAPVPDADGYYFQVGGEMWLHDLDGQRVRKIASGSSHSDVGRDGKGRQVLVSHTSPWPTAPASQLMVGDIATGQESVGLHIEGPPSWDMDLHVSGRGEDGYFYVSLFRPQRFGGQPDVSAWEPFFHEILRLHVGDVTDPSTYSIERMLHHRSEVRAAPGYWRQPHCSVSMEGDRIVWGSDFGQHPEIDHYADAYLHVIGGELPDDPPPDDPDDPPPADDDSTVEEIATAVRAKLKPDLDAVAAAMIAVSQELNELPDEIRERVRTLTLSYDPEE